MRTGIIALGLINRVDLQVLLPALHANLRGNEMHVFTDAPVDVAIMGNLHIHVIGKPVSSFLSRRWWLDMKLPPVLKQSRIDVLLCLAGDASLGTNIPQVLLVDELRHLHDVKNITKAERLYRNFFLPRCFKKAKAVLATSGHIRKDLITQFKLGDEKLEIIQPYVDPLFTSLGWEESEQVKNTFSNGREYFLSPITEETVISVLKAFSQFKKWQRSDMKLILKGKMTDNNLAKLQTYKYRDDVVILNHPPKAEFAKLLAASYAFVYTPVYEGSGLKVIEAMKSGAPVIASDLDGVKEVAGDAVLYATPGNEEMLAAQMIKLHKDETLRSNLIDAGKVQAGNYQPSVAIDAIWQVLQKTALENTQHGE